MICSTKEQFVPGPLKLCERVFFLCVLLTIQFSCVFAIWALESGIDSMGWDVWVTLSHVSDDVQGTTPVQTIGCPT